MQKIKFLITGCFTFFVFFIQASSPLVHALPASAGLIVEKTISHKPTWKQKIINRAWDKKIKQELKKGPRSKIKDKGKAALIISIIGLGLLLIPYLGLFSLPLAIIAIIMGHQELKRNPENKNARLAKILGFVTIGLFVLFISIALLIILAFTI